MSRPFADIRSANEMAYLGPNYRSLTVVEDPNGGYWILRGRDTPVGAELWCMGMDGRVEGWPASTKGKYVWDVPVGGSYRQVCYVITD